MEMSPPARRRGGGLRDVRDRRAVLQVARSSSRGSGLPRRDARPDGGPRPGQRRRRRLPRPGARRLEQAHALLARPGVRLGRSGADGGRRFGGARASRRRAPATRCCSSPATPTTPRRGSASRVPSLRVMSAGRVIEIYKEVGRPRAFAERFALADFRGTHGLGHTRMATESRVTTEGSHPFSTGRDLCLVHNGSLSNHNRLRERLRREGIAFQTENDTEVAAGYLTWRLREGASLERGARGLPRRPRRLLHLPRRHRRRLRGPARPDRLQAGRARRDRRLGRDGLRVPRDRGPAGRRRRADLGARAGRRLRLGEGARSA